MESTQTKAPQPLSSHGTHRLNSHAASMSVDNYSIAFLTKIAGGIKTCDYNRNL